MSSEVSSAWRPLLYSKVICNMQINLSDITSSPQGNVRNHETLGGETKKKSPANYPLGAICGVVCIMAWVVNSERYVMYCFPTLCTLSALLIPPLCPCPNLISKHFSDSIAAKQVSQAISAPILYPDQLLLGTHSMVHHETPSE